MEFFDPKTEVLRFQFTSHGLKELSQGRFQPEMFLPQDDGVEYSPSLPRDEFLDALRGCVFIKGNKLPPELDSEDSGQIWHHSTVYEVQEDSEEENLVRSSLHARVHGTSVLSASAALGTIQVGLEPVFVFKSQEIPLSDIPNESDNQETDIIRVDGKYFHFQNGHLLIDITEGGTPSGYENFECFLYEVVDNEEVPVYLFGKEKQGALFVPQDEIPATSEDVLVLCDGDIPADILCEAKNKLYIGDSSNVFLVDDGVVSGETAGKSCRVISESKPMVYYGRNEGELGDGCRNV